MGYFPPKLHLLDELRGFCNKRRDVMLLCEILCKVLFVRFKCLSSQHQDPRGFAVSGWRCTTYVSIERCSEF